MESKVFDFFISGEDRQVFPGSDLWEVPLSGKNAGQSVDTPSNPSARVPVITIGDYFFAARRFLSGNDFSLLKTGLEGALKRPVPVCQIDRISVFLEKHGAFYHPLKIQVTLNSNRSCSFVLNGAVSKPGLALIENEYLLISKLNTMGGDRYLPQVFGVDILETDRGRFGFFLGEWFEGYKEFHATEDQGRRKIVIWESDGSCLTITEAAAFPIYREIAKILTGYYHIETFEQVSPWHHAAGDFIVRQDEDSFHVRMITARGYSSLTEFSAHGEDKKKHILPSLLFFFLNLTIRIRLDRINGTGPVVMLGKETIPAVVEGFLDALDEKTVCHDYGDIRLAFIDFFRQFTPEQMAGLIETIFESCRPDASEISVIEENLDSHCSLLYSIFKNA